MVVLAAAAYVSPALPPVAFSIVTIAFFLTATAWIISYVWWGE
jgi:hypothetical protein